MSRLGLPIAAFLVRMKVAESLETKNLSIVWHVIGWLLFAAYSTFVYAYNYGYKNVTVLLAPYQLAQMMVFYVYYLVIFKEVIKEKFLRAAVIGISAIIGFYILIFFRSYIGELLYPEEGAINTFGFYLIRYSWDVLQMITAAFALFYYEESIKKEKEKRYLQKRYYDNEINYLKGQINQHFLYNLFGFFYAKARENSVSLGDAILDLSDLFRYSVNKKFIELSSLSNEWENVETFMRLNDYRFEGKVQKDINISGKLTKIQVPHLIILTLVENAYKHGDLLNFPLEIWLSVEGNKMVFSMKNRCHQAILSKNQGIGLENIEKRLELLGFVYEFNYYRENDDFYTKLDLKAKG